MVVSVVAMCPGRVVGCMVDCLVVEGEDQVQMFVRVGAVGPVRVRGIHRFWKSKGDEMRREREWEDGIFRDD